MALASVVFAFIPFLCPVGIVCGHLALHRAKDLDVPSARCLAWVGLVFGYTILIGGSFILYHAYVPAPEFIP